MNIRILLILCGSIFFTSTASPLTPVKRKTAHTRRMDRKVTELMADRVGFKKELASINARMMEAEMAEENRRFPADELYGSVWDNRWLNPYKKGNVAIPDSFKVDCSSFVLPIFTNRVCVTSPYGPRRRRMHRGIDLKLNVGDTVRAAFDGKVRIENYESRGYGFYAVVRHTNGLETVYGHLSHFLVGENDYVRAGQPIALGGNTGRSTGPHLHFETRFLGKDINPADIIDFQNSVPYQDLYVFHKSSQGNRNENVYTSSDVQMVYHRVKSGDTLSEIAHRYGITVSALCKLNGLKRHSVLHLGQALRCSSGGSRIATSDDDKTKLASKRSGKKISVDVSNDVKAQYHRVKSGDTLSEIAERYGTSVRKLCELNGISRTTNLRLGRSLRCS